MLPILRLYFRNSAMAYFLSKPIIFQQAKCSMYWTQTCSLKRPFNVKKIAIYTITKLMSRAANNNNNQTRWKAEIKIVKKPVNPSVHCRPIWHNNMLIKGGLIPKGISPFGLIFKKMYKIKFLKEKWKSWGWDQM